MWKRIRDKLAYLRNLDGRYGIPCSSSHKYQSNPVALESEVAAIERKYGVSLPDDYRTYLTTFANGGAGPFHGIYPLARYRDLEWHMWDEGPFAVQPREPFRLSGAWNLPSDFLAARRGENVVAPRRMAELERAAAACLALVGRALPEPSGKVVGTNPFTGEPIPEGLDTLIMNAEFSNDLMDGSVPIATQGCNLGVSLVVTGPERGSVWYDLRADDNGIVPAHSSATARLTFGQWYERWVDDSIAHLARTTP